MSRRASTMIVAALWLATAVIGVVTLSTIAGVRVGFVLNGVSGVNRAKVASKSATNEC